MIISQEINNQALEEWKAYRKGMKKPLSDLALKKVINLLIKYDVDTQQSMVDKSIQNDWRGLFKPEIKEVKQELSFVEKHTDRSWAD